MWQVAVLWCYVEGVITVKVAVRLESNSNSNQHLQLTMYHLYCCILLVFFLHNVIVVSCLYALPKFERATAPPPLFRRLSVFHPLTPFKGNFEDICDCVALVE